MCRHKTQQKLFKEKKAHNLYVCVRCDELSYPVFLQVFCRHAPIPLYSSRYKTIHLMACLCLQETTLPKVAWNNTHYVYIRMLMMLLLLLLVFMMLLLLLAGELVLLYHLQKPVPCAIRKFSRRRFLHWCNQQSYFVINSIVFMFHPLSNAIDACYFSNSFLSQCCRFRLFTES